MSGGFCPEVEGSIPLLTTTEGGGQEEKVLRERGAEPGSGAGIELERNVGVSSDVAVMIEFEETREQGQEDVEMNDAHDASSDGTEGARQPSTGENLSPRRGTGSASTDKTCKSESASSSSSFHISMGSKHTEGSSSEQTEGASDQTHRQMMRAVREMKKCLASEKRYRSKASTMEALKYALSCVKQVQAHSEYYNLLMSSCLEDRHEERVYTLEELDNITSEHILKNTDTFVAALSLASGRILYASEQASAILNCKRKLLHSTKFVELLHHQDINVFYAHTARPHLPPWNVPTDNTSLRFDCAQVKSFFCRIRCGKDQEGKMRYNPFRITPSLQMIRGGAGGVEEQPCSLVLAERIIAGYKAPRIPVDKQIFTTTHSPGCVFLEVDDRAVPLLGYLPQELIGTSLLSYLHPEDFSFILSMHRKVVKYAGKAPFEHSPVRFYCQNGDYITLDTSWSSFINPWSRKVAFIIGRHKVRTGPLNEDVFSALGKKDVPIANEEIKDLQAKIYKLFQQPVHNDGSSGYGSLGSNGSHEHYISVASSSDSNGNLWEDSYPERVNLQQICANVTKVGSWGQQAYLDSQNKLTPNDKPKTGPIGQRALFAHMAQKAGVRGHEQSRKQPHISSFQQINCVDSVIRYLESCTGPAPKRKSESCSVDTTSSSEGDRISAVPPHDQANPDVALEGGVIPESQVSAGSAITMGPHTTATVVRTSLTDITLSTKAMSVVSAISQCSYSSTIVHVPHPESEVTALEDTLIGSEQANPGPTPARPVPEERRRVGLTKEVLSAHTQKEEQEYVDRFSHHILQSPYGSYLQQDDDSLAHSHRPGEHSRRALSAPGAWTKSRTSKAKHKRPKPQLPSDSYPSPTRDPHPPYQVHGTLQRPWPSSELSQPDAGFLPLRTPVFALGQPGGDAMVQQAGAVPADPPMPYVQATQTFPQLQATQTSPQLQASQTCVNPYVTPVMTVLLPSYPTVAVYPHAPPSHLPHHPLDLTSGNPGGNPPLLVPQTPAPRPPPTAGAPPSPVAEEPVEAEPRVLFSSSRSSSPLQLNLLQEELPTHARAPGSGGRRQAEGLRQGCAKKAPYGCGNPDGQSTSSELLDVLFQEDVRSGTGSNASRSGSLGSGSGSGLGSRGTSTSHTGQSRNSSEYFASNDSSDTSHKARMGPEVGAMENVGMDPGTGDPLWTSSHVDTPNPVAMTYQIHPRDQTQVLKGDLEKLLLLQPSQPWFTQKQKEELAEVHPWIRQQGIPRAIDTQGCLTCNTGMGLSHHPYQQTPNRPSVSTALHRPPAPPTTPDLTSHPAKQHLSTV